jgi:hypothetical protein
MLTLEFLQLIQILSRLLVPKETILVSVIGHSDFHTSPDLILTEDINGVNAGMQTLHIIHLYVQALLYFFIKITLQGNFCHMSHSLAQHLLLLPFPF